VSPEEGGQAGEGVATGSVTVAADDLAPRSVAWLPDLAHAALDLLIDGETGLWRLAHPEPVTRAALLRELAARLGHDPGKVVPLSRARRDEGVVPAPAPAGGTLGSERGLLLPGVDAALARLAAA
jgi:dTDP-4-dehydrorhamnose reductase